MSVADFHNQTLKCLLQIINIRAVTVNYYFESNTKYVELLLI